MVSRGQGTNLVRFLSWAQNPYIKRVNIAFCLVADKLSELNERLVQNPHVAAIEIPLPDRAERERFSRWVSRAQDFSQLTEFTPEQLAELSNGLSLVNLNVLLAQAKQTERRVDGERFRRLKKTIIERQCQGLLEFVEPSHTLDLVVGQEAAKERLREDAELIARGQLDTAPMGYLLCGPVGTGKIVPGRMLRRLDRHPVRQAAQLPLQVCRRDRRQPGASADRAAFARPGGGHDR